MSRLLLAAALVGAVGCTAIRPVGPMAQMMGGAPGPGGGKAKGKDADGPPEPVTVPAVKPTPPVNTTGPEDVTADDPHLAARKLMQELEADRKTIPPAPVTAEVSRYKNGVKQN